MVGLSALSSCALIDEKYSDCVQDYQLDYTMCLVTNMTTELQTQLALATDISVSHALKDYLAEAFNDKAHDVNLHFYDVEGDSLLLHQEAHVMDATETSYSLEIPIRRYMHLAVANARKNGRLELMSPDKCHEFAVRQQIGDTLDCHEAGLYTARLPMDVQAGEDQEFDVQLYMATASSALVLDTLGSGIADVQVFLSGFATSFDVCDSTYHYDYTPILRTRQINTKEGHELCFAGIHFPSPDVPEVKAVIETPDPSVGEQADNALWYLRVYVTLKDQTTTETILGVRQPLQAGQLKVIKAQVHDNGSLISPDPTVTISVTLDWQGGTSHTVLL